MGYLTKCKVAKAICRICRLPTVYDESNFGKASFEPGIGERRMTDRETEE